MPPKRPSDLHAADPRSARLEVRVRPNELDALTAIAEAEDVPVSVIVRRALGGYLSQLDEDEIVGRRGRRRPEGA
jgi:hypothetical protein